MNIYYKVVNDYILSLQTKVKDWKWRALFGMSFPMTFLLIFINFFLLYFDLNSLSDFFIFKDTLIKPIYGLINFTFFFVIPPLFLNYFIIVYKDNYKSFLDKSEYKEGRYYWSYFIFCFSINIVLFIMLLMTAEPR
jgi:hypothetical protein